MDLQLYFRVFWRFRFLVATGLLVALALSALSLVSVGPSGVTYRQQEVWSSSAKLLVTAEGFPEGRTITELYTFRIDETGERIAEPLFPSTARLRELAAHYSALATIDDARAVITRDGPLPGTPSAATLSSSDGESLPFVVMTGTATSPEAAIATANRAATGLVKYIEQRQASEDDLPAHQRTVFTVVEQASAATLLVPRKLTRPIFIFLAVMMAVLGLAFVLENMRPRVRPVASEPEAPVLRRTA